MKERIGRIAQGGSRSLSRPLYGPAIDLAIAKRIAAAVEEEASRSGCPVAIAVSDCHGFLVFFVRMDGIQTASVDLAAGKAATAAMYRRPTKEFQQGIEKGLLACLSLPNVVPVEGGLPILHEGKVIGGLGVSGAAADQDSLFAEAGLAILS